MAPSKDIAPLLPDTLPEDFSEWDGKTPAAPPPPSSREREEWEAGDAFIETAKPLWQAADSDALLASLVDEPPDFGSTASSSIFVKQQEELVDWAAEAAPAPKPAARTGWNEWEAKHSFSKTQKSPGQSVDREATLPLGGKPHDSDSAAPAPVFVKQQESTEQLGDGSPSPDSQIPEVQAETSEVAVAASVAEADETSTSAEPEVTTKRKADEAVFQLFSQKKVEVTSDLKTPKKKKMIVAGISAGAILLPLLIMIPLLHHGSKSEAKHSVQPLPGESVTEVPASMPDTPAAKPLPQGKPQAATTEKPQTTDNQTSNQPSTQDEGTTPAQVQSTMMSDQLTAPTRIPKQTAENAPPANDTAGAEGLGGNGPNASMFNGHSQPTVKVSRPVPISSGIATGMLIQSTPPVYPPLARTAHVAGTVEVHATIATNGTIKDLRAVSGPAMLRQAAVDAVRNWRYKPYRLNDQPVEVETTINIVFTLGG
jgi:TonB family protein